MTIVDATQKLSLLIVHTASSMGALVDVAT